MPVLRTLWICCLILCSPAIFAGETPAATPSETQALVSRGKLLFIQCRACHEVSAGAPHKVGPNLHGMFGITAGTVTGFQFSDALRQSKLVWNDETLDRWITRPTDVVPGTVMAFAGISNERDRRALIAYLKDATR